MASVFTKIIRGELPCYKVYEDEMVIAILAKDQIHLGHTLVIPKQEIDHWTDLPETLYVHLQKCAMRIGRAIQKVTECRRVLTAAIGYEVPHFHLHLIPSWSMADLNFSKARTRPHEEMEKMAERLRQALGH
ncbi:MAG: HIT family protein [Bdellovibrionaceae bacterium]|nr:HIT family protein [Pseudobdellovibrionaceae bacterium]MDW8190684.1 HIT family protein [Pseudobdellovibrionaceae bacterium]